MGFVDPIEGLLRDHELILVLLDALERLSQQSRDLPLRTAPWERALELVRRFADTAHHAKEERVLFPALADAGLPERHGPLGVMRHEHELGRQYVQDMQHALSLAQRDPGKAREGLARGAGLFVGHLRQHIAKENHVLFPMARDLLTASALAEAAAACHALEVEVLGPGGVETVREQVMQLSSETSPAKTTSPF